MDGDRGTGRLLDEGIDAEGSAGVATRIEGCAQRGTGTTIPGMENKLTKIVFGVGTTVELLGQKKPGMFVGTGELLGQKKTGTISGGG